MAMFTPAQKPRGLARITLIGAEYVRLCQSAGASFTSYRPRDTVVHHAVPPPARMRPQRREPREGTRRVSCVGSAVRTIFLRSTRRGPHGAPYQPPFSSRAFAP